MSDVKKDLPTKDVTAKVDQTFKGKEVKAGGKMQVTEHQEKLMKSRGLI